MSTVHSSHKERGNYPCMCMKFDCKNRGKKCDKCVGYCGEPTEYVKGGKK